MAINYFKRFEGWERHEIDGSEMEVGQIVITDNEVAVVVEGPFDNEWWDEEIPCYKIAGQHRDGTMFGPITIEQYDEVSVIFPDSRNRRWFEQRVDKQIAQ